jgi:hypothetical protein
MLCITIPHGLMKCWFKEFAGRLNLFGLIGGVSVWDENIVSMFRVEFFWNVGNHIKDCCASPSWPWLTPLLLSEPQISDKLTFFSDGLEGYDSNLRTILKWVLRIWVALKWVHM